MDRFMSQLGIDEIESLLSRIGLTYWDTDTSEWVYDVTTITNALNQIASADITEGIHTLELETSDKWYINGTGRIEVDYARSEVYYESIISNAIQVIKIDLDTGNNLSLATMNTYLENDDYNGLRTWLDAWAASYGPAQAPAINARLNSDIYGTVNWVQVRQADEVMVNITDTFSNLALAGLASDSPLTVQIYNAFFGSNISVSYYSNIGNLFAILNLFDYGLKDLFNALGLTIPQVLTSILFGNGIQPANELFGEAYGQDSDETLTPAFDSVSPVLNGSIESQSLVFLVALMSLIIVFFLLSITKGSVTINRREFLSKEDIQNNISHFNKQVETLGGKVSMQNSEALVIRAFRTQGKIEKLPDVEKRAKQYVENQKLLVTLQSRASRAYVAQKFKDCISAIEKMIEIARKLEDQTLVANYEENLAKVVKLLRRKGIAVRTKVRTEEQKPAEELENLKMYKKDLVDLQNKASKLFAEKNWAGAKECIKEMLAIAKKIQDPVLIRNYEANLRKIIAMEKGG
jgi:hypothetical protein